MIQIVKDKGEGCASYTWSKPGDDITHHEKVSFVKIFEPYDWFIGAGEYVDDVEHDIQTEVLARIEEISFGNNNYIFAGQWDGLALSGPAKGKNMIDVTDVNGVKILQELIARSKSGSGFVQYVIPKFGDGRTAPKLSYVEGVADWGWYIGAGILLDDMEVEIAQLQNNAEVEVRYYIIMIIWILMVFIGIIFLLSRRMRNKVQSNFDKFDHFFERSMSERMTLDPTDMDYAELEVLARGANNMALARNEAEINLMRAKEEAEFANRTKSEFLAHMSHELRTPLNSVIGYSQMLSSKIFDKNTDPRVAEYSNNIQTSGEHLLHIINDILDISRIEADEVTLEEKPEELSKNIKWALITMQPKIMAADLQTSTEIFPDNVAILADQRYVRQILLNLLSNAVKYTPKGGSIIMKAGLDDDGAAYLSITDTGVGIAPEDIPRVLKPFGQSQTNAHISHEGTGLGLSLSSKLSEIHGGKLSVESAVGKGTTVTVQFPAKRTITP